MHLTLLIDDDTRQLSVTAEMLEDAQPLLEKIDLDMDKGWQLAKTFIPFPTRLQRCQITANRLLTALHTQNQASATLMSAYIISRLPGVCTAVLNTAGEADETLFYDQNNSVMS